MACNLQIKNLADDFVTIKWDDDGSDAYRVYWADKNIPTMRYDFMCETKKTEYTLKKGTHVPHYLKVASIKDGNTVHVSDVLKTECKKILHVQREELSRGLAVVACEEGIFIGWRMFVDEVTGYSETGLTGTDFVIYKNGKKLCTVTDSCNYIDKDGTKDDEYAVAPIEDGIEGECCKAEKAWASGQNYFDIPVKRPASDVTPKGEPFEYTLNDISVGDVDGDGEFEYIVKWEPSNAKDVSQKGYTGKCILDCYKIDGTILWRLDMGVNIRAGAHYTQFMVFDFNGDGKAEMAVKTAPGTKMTTYNADGSVKSEKYITMPEEDIEAGYSNEDDYRCSAEDYFDHMVEVFMGWHEHEMVVSGQWPATLEKCFGIENKYTYPLSKDDATELANYFMDVYAPSRSAKNELRSFEGFIFKGPEYLTMFAGDGEELDTIPFKFKREDDGLMWADYALPRIEPMNRVDRFLSGVAYLDGERPYLIVGRGYYTRATIVAYDFFQNSFHEYWSVDSGWVLMENPFGSGAHEAMGCDPVYGSFAGQGDHSLSIADVDGDGYQEVVYGSAVIDHDGSLLYSSYGYLANGEYAKFGHGDSMHVAVIDPDTPGLEIFNVFEGAKFAPYGYALRKAETGEVIYGEPADSDLGRCLIGKINKEVRGLQTWCTGVRSATGEWLSDKGLSTNQKINWAGDLTSQAVRGWSRDGAGACGIISDNIHGDMLVPHGCLTNNHTKGNPCLIADIFGDFREELIMRTADNSALRVFTNTELSPHKLFTLLDDLQYRVSVAWQNNCYNQPGYTSFYLASDMEFEYVLPALAKH